MEKTVNLSIFIYQNFTNPDFIKRSFYGFCRLNMRYFGAIITYGY